MPAETPNPAPPGDGDPPAQRVLIVEDQVVLAEALAAALGVQPDLEVVGTPGTAADAVRAAEEHRPDVVLMDVMLPDGDGLEVTRRITRLLPGCRVIVLTGLTRPEVLAAAAAAGASGFLAKESSLAEVLGAIRAPAGTTMLVEASALRGLARRLEAGDDAASRARAQELGLTDREDEVLRLLGQGLDTRVIAERLVLSPHTCRGHIKNILLKLGAHSQLEAVVIGHRLGLFPATTPDIGSPPQS